MNDRFKVRIWDKSFRKMLYNNLILCYKNKITAYDYLDNTHKAYLPQDHIVIEQCTGKKDVKGNLIYEGDIVTWVRPFKDGDVQNVCQIVYDEKHATFGPMLGDFPCQMPQQSELYMHLMGNIHENPELLKECK